MKRRYLALILTALIFLSACSAVQPQSSTTTKTESTPTVDDTFPSVQESSETPTEELPPDFAAMRKKIFTEYPVISNLCFTYDFQIEEMKLFYADHYTARGKKAPTLEEYCLRQARTHPYLYIEPYSDTTITFEQIAQLREGIHITDYLDVLGKYPDYRLPAEFGVDQTVYYYLEDGRILKLYSRFYHTHDRNEAGPYDYNLGDGYWPERLLSFEIITFDDLIKDAEQAMTDYPKYTNHRDPRTDEDYAQGWYLKYYWPEIFVTKYGIE